MNKKQLGEIISRAESLCDQRGVRFTSLRKRVFTLLCTSDKPLSAYEILDLLRTSTTNPAPPHCLSYTRFSSSTEISPQAGESSCLCWLLTPRAPSLQSIPDLWRLW